MGGIIRVMTPKTLYCANCHRFKGSEDECVEYNSGRLYCPNCCTFIGYKTQPIYAQNIGLEFRDYIDYFKENSGVKIILNRMLGHVKTDRSLSFDTLDFNNKNQVNELLKENFADFRGNLEQTHKQYQTIVNLHDDVKKYYSDEYLLDNEQIKYLNRMQSSFLITYLTSLMSLLKRPTVKQYDFLKKLEKEYTHYHYFDDSLTLERYSFEDIYDRVSRFEMSERISVLKEVKKYVNGDVFDIIPDSNIDYELFEDKVKEWKERKKHDN